VHVPLAVPACFRAMSMAALALCAGVRGAAALLDVLSLLSLSQVHAVPALPASFLILSMAELAVHSVAAMLVAPIAGLFCEALFGVHGVLLLVFKYIS
jgi:hypothetical protein